MNPLIIVAVISAIMSGSGSWWLTRNYFLAQKYYEVREEQIKEQHLKEAIHRMGKNTEKLEHKLLAAQAKETIKYEEVIKYVPKYITKIQKTDSACNLTNGAVIMLNRASNNGLPKTAAVDDATNTRPSNIRTSDVIGYTAKIQTQYKRFAQQCRSLIKWNKNVRSNKLRTD